MRIYNPYHIMDIFWSFNKGAPGERSPMYFVVGSERYTITDMFIDMEGSTFCITYDDKGEERYVAEPYDEDKGLDNLMYDSVIRAICPAGHENIEYYNKVFKTGQIKSKRITVHDNRPIFLLDKMKENRPILFYDGKKNRQVKNIEIELSVNTNKSAGLPPSRTGLMIITCGKNSIYTIPLNTYGDMDGYYYDIIMVDLVDNLLNGAKPEDQKMEIIIKKNNKLMGF